MTVALYLMLGLLYLYFSGFGLTGILLGGDRHRHLFVFLNGFCLTVAVFSESFLIFNDATPAFFAAVGVSFLLNLVYLFIRRHEKREPQPVRSRSPRRTAVARARLSVIILALGIVIFISWSFFFSGWNSYWGSANEDIFDALYGRDAYLNGSAGEVARFLDPLTRYQYSSLAFWSILFQSFGGMNVFYLQGQMMLFLQVVGIYVLTKQGFRFSHKRALAAAAVASCGSFYVSTFFTGHEGSMIFGAIIPFLLGLSITAVMRGSMSWRHGIAIVLWLLVIVHSYVFPLGFSIIPLVFFALYHVVMMDQGRHARWKDWWQRLKAMPEETGARFLKIAAIIFCFVLAAGLAYGLLDRTWFALETVRHRAATVFRAWGISHFKEMLLIYWGLIPSSIPFGVIANPAKLDVPAIMISGYACAALLIGGLLYSGRTILRRPGSPALFLVFYLVSWCLTFLVMKYFVVDSYYLYKFYYTNYYIGIIILVAGWTHAFRKVKGLAFSPSRRISAIVAGFLASVFILLNLSYIFLYNLDVASRPYNQRSSKLADVSPLRQYAKAGVFFNLSKFDPQNLLRYMFHQNNFPFPDAVSQFFEYELEVVGVQDIVHHRREDRTLVFEDGTFRLYKSGQHDKLGLDTYYQGERYPEFYDNHAFRWVKDDVVLEVIDPSPRSHRLFVCLEPGPGVRYRPFMLYTFVNGIVADSVLVHGAQLVEVNLPPLEKRVNEVKIMTREKGRNFLPWEERHLNYRVALIGMKDDHYLSDALKILNAPEDIIPPRSWYTLSLSPASWKDSSNVLLIGNNWNPVERDGAQRLRWAFNDAEFLIFNPTSDTRVLDITVEKGPALAGMKPTLTFLLNGAPFDSLDLGELQTVRLRLPVLLQKQNIVTLKVNQVGIPVGRDPRVLNFRVLEAHLSKE